MECVAVVYSLGKSRVKAYVVPSDRKVGTGVYTPSSVRRDER